MYVREYTGKKSYVGNNQKHVWKRCVNEVTTTRGNGEWETNIYISLSIYRVAVAAARGALAAVESAFVTEQPAAVTDTTAWSKKLAVTTVATIEWTATAAAVVISTTDRTLIIVINIELALISFYKCVLLWFSLLIRKSSVIRLWLYLYYTTMLPLTIQFASSMPLILMLMLMLILMLK